MEIEIYNHTSQYLLRYNSTSFSLRYLFDHRQTPVKLSFKKPSSREERKLKVSKERRKEKKERESERGKRRKEICRLTTLRFTTPSYRLTYRRQWRREEARVARAERARIDSDSSGELSALWRLSRGFLPPSAATWGRRGSLGARLVVLVAAVHEEEARTRSQGSLSGAFHRFHGDRRARAARPRAGACAYPPASGGNRFWPSPTPEQPGTTERTEREGNSSPGQSRIVRDRDRSAPPNRHVRDHRLSYSPLLSSSGVSWRMMDRWSRSGKISRVFERVWTGRRLSDLFVFELDCNVMKMC